MTRYLLFLLITIGFFELSGQSRKQDYRFDFGANMTSVLVSFSGNESIVTAESLPILIRTPKGARLGLGLSGRSNEIRDPITGGLRKSVEQRYFLSLGFQSDVPSEIKFVGYYGLDLLAKYVRGKVTTQVTGFDTTLRDDIIGGGASAFFGMRYHITPRLYLSTETNLQFLYQSEITQDVSGEILRNGGESFQLNPPLFLYLNLRI